MGFDDTGTGATEGEPDEEGAGDEKGGLSVHIEEEDEIYVGAAEEGATHVVELVVEDEEVEAHVGAAEVLERRIQTVFGRQTLCFDLGGKGGYISAAAMELTPNTNISNTTNPLILKSRAY